MALSNKKEDLLKQALLESDFIYHRKTLNYVMYPHFHEEYEISFVLTDGIIFNVGAKSYELKNSSVIVFNENDIHMAVVPQKDVLYERFGLCFTPKFIQDMCLSNPELLDQFVNRNEDFQHCVQLDETQKEKMLMLFNKMLESYADKDSNSYKLKIKLILCEILIYINEVYYKINLPIKNYRCDDQLNKIMEYIKNNLTADLSLHTIASNFFIGKQTLIKNFKKAIGMTPNQYIIYCRIMKSREFLKQKLPIYRVCELVGYLNTSSFTRTFKKLIGCTPKKYQVDRIWTD